MKFKLQKRGLLMLGFAACLALAAPRATGAPAADIDQIRNGSFDNPNEPPNWVNGNAGLENAHFREGHSIAYRVKCTDLTPGSTITLRLGYDVRNSGKNSLDYLTGFQNLDPHNFGTHTHAEHVNPTLGTPFENTSLPNTTVPTPDDTTAILTPPVNRIVPSTGLLQPTNSFKNLAAAKVIALWGGTFSGAEFA